MESHKFKVGERVEFSDHKNAKKVTGIVVDCLSKSNQVLIRETNCKNNTTSTYVVKPKSLHHIS
jgi:hypothetical protein